MNRVQFEALVTTARFVRARLHQDADKIAIDNPLDTFGVDLPLFAKFANTFVRSACECTNPEEITSIDAAKLGYVCAAIDRVMCHSSATYGILDTVRRLCRTLAAMNIIGGEAIDEQTQTITFM